MQKRLIANLQAWRGIGAMLILVHHMGLHCSAAEMLKRMLSGRRAWQM